MDATFSHYVEYDSDTDASVDEVIASLKANEILLGLAADVLEALAPGLEIQSATVTVRQLDQSSPLKELFAFALVLTYQKELETEVPDLIEQITGVHIPDQYDTLITVLVMLIAIYGIAKVYERLFPGRKPHQLETDRERLIASASASTRVPESSIDDALQGVVSGRSRSRIETAARRFFRPVLGRKTNGIRSRGHDVMISPGSILELPSDAMLVMEQADDEPHIRSEIMRGVKIILHAMDRDHAKSGWAGHIVGVTRERIKLILDKEINPERLFGRKQITGDILMVYDVNDHGEETPREFHLLSMR